MSYRGSLTIGGLALLAVLILLAASPAVAYERYSINDNATNCRFCHGDFRASSYTSLSDGQNWGNLHNLHRFDMLDGDCDTCHLASDEFPVLLNDSAGGDGLPSIGCVGCHGRAEDATGGGTEGYGIAMQRRHEAVNAGGDQNGETCFNCHEVGETATPVGEHVLPPYYANPGIGHPNMPDDPCNPPPGFPEDFAGMGLGIDNDGDLVADQADPDCQTSTATPGEASGNGLPVLLVTAHDPGPGSMTISYGAACSATDHTLEFGSLALVSTYTYAGQACNMGDSGSFVWAYPAAPESLFFLVAGNDGSAEGSYGLDGNLLERPEDTVNVDCPLPQDLADRCD